MSNNVSTPATSLTRCPSLGARAVEDFLALLEPGSAPMKLKMSGHAIVKSSGNWHFFHMLVR